MPTVPDTTMTTTTTDPHAQWLDGWRQLIDFLAEHPEVPLPHFYQGKRAVIFASVADDQREQVATIARAMGHAEKHFDGDRFEVHRRFGAITLVVQADRAEVCERVVVGTHEVTEEVPDPDALAAVPTVTVTRVEEQVEWVCGPLLAGGAS